eukprot:764466-Hanusia_phi.AAC.5
MNAPSSKAPGQQLRYRVVIKEGMECQPRIGSRDDHSDRTVTVCRAYGDGSRRQLQSVRPVLRLGLRVAARYVLLSCSLLRQFESFSTSLIVPELPAPDLIL